MASQKKIARLTSSHRNHGGRTGDVDTTALPHQDGNNGKGRVKLEKMIDVNRATGKPSEHGGSNRGDRRDMSKAYSGTERHPSRGNTPRVDVKTRKR